MSRVIRRVGVCLLSLVLLLGIAGGVLWLLATAEPEGFERNWQARGEEQIRREANEFDRAASYDVHSRVEIGAPVSVSLRDAAVNSRLHQFMVVDPDLLGEGIACPQVHFRDGPVVVMAEVRSGAVRGVVSLAGRPSLDARGRLSLSRIQLSVGRLPMPPPVWDALRGRLDARIARMAPGAERTWLEALETLLDGGAVDVATLPPLDQDGYRLTELTVSGGRLTFRLTPQSPP